MSKSLGNQLPESIELINYIQGTGNLIKSKYIEKPGIQLIYLPKKCHYSSPNGDTTIEINRNRT